MWQIFDGQKFVLKTNKWKEEDGIEVLNKGELEESGQV